MKWYIGTSGWSYDAWEGAFYPPQLPAGGRLRFYAKHLDTVEINNSFYHLPTREQFKKWEQQVPSHFLFAVKGSRYITHIKRLKNPEESLAMLLSRLQGVPRMGPVIFQLPPRFQYNQERLEVLLRALPKDRRFAIEFRDSSWHTDEVYDLLKRHNVAFCLFEKGRLRSPRLVTADFIYVRLHGRKEGYKGRYTDAILEDWHRWLAKQHKDVYLFFDNTDEKIHAIENALAFRNLTEKIL